jgi:hypothetical protein
MTPKLTTGLVLYVVIIIVGLIPLQQSQYQKSPEGSILDETSTLYLPNDSLPHREYQRIMDSIKNVETEASTRVKYSGSSTSFLGFGFAKWEDNDFVSEEGKTKEPDEYFLKLDNYRTTDYLVKSVYQNGKYFLVYPVWDDPSASESKGHMEKKEVALKYVPSENSNERGSLFLQVSKSKYNFLQILITLLIWVFGSLYIVAIIYLPAVTLYKISKGEPFHPVNYRYLIIIGSLLIAYAVLPVLVGLFVNKLYNETIPQGLYYPFWEVLIEQKYMVMTGLVLLLIAYAFKKGGKLEEEQALII